MQAGSRGVIARIGTPDTIFFCWRSPQSTWLPLMYWPPSFLMNQVMLDVDGDGKIEYEEFMDTVKTSLAMEKKQLNDEGMAPDTHAVMDRLVSHLQSATVGWMIKPDA